MEERNIEANQQRRTVVLDIDETLLHSFFVDKLTPTQMDFLEQEMEREKKLDYYNRRFHLIQVGATEYVVVSVRPGLWTFLSKLSTLYDIVIWSAAGPDYVYHMCRFLFPEKSPLLQWNWHHCHSSEQYIYCKPISMVADCLDVPLHSILLVDNRAENGAHFPDHLVRVNDWDPKWNSESNKLEPVFEHPSYLYSTCYYNIQSTFEFIQPFFHIEDVQY